MAVFFYFFFSENTGFTACILITCKKALEGSSQWISDNKNVQIPPWTAGFSTDMKQTHEQLKQNT